MYNEFLIQCYQHVNSNNNIGTSISDKNELYYNILLYLQGDLPNMLFLKMYS